MHPSGPGAAGPTFRGEIFPQIVREYREWAARGANDARCGRARSDQM